MSACPHRHFGLPHSWVTVLWDKYGTGVKDSERTICRHCYVEKPHDS